MSNYFEHQYLNLLYKAINEGSYEQNRTGVATYGTWGEKIEHDLSNGFPILTTRKIGFKLAVKELLFFLSGETDTKILEDQGVYIWKKNTSRKFLDSRGLDFLPEGDLGAAYGYQYKNFDKPLNAKRRPSVWTDQIETVKDQLINHSESRRIIISGWNPNQLDEMALPCCVMLYHFRVRQGQYLDIQMSQRSADLYLGEPHNIQETALMCHLFANYVGLTPGKMVISLGDAHVYENHLDNVKKLIMRTVKELPKLCITNNKRGCDPLKMSPDDLSLEGYNPHPALENVNMVE